MKPDFHSGKRLALARKLNGLTQENLVGELGFPQVNVKTLRRWEKEHINLSRIEDISSYFKAPAWIFTEESLDENLFKRLLLDPQLADHHRGFATQPGATEGEVQGVDWFNQASNLMLQDQFTKFVQQVQGQDINSTGPDGWTLMMWAAHWGKLNYIHWLIQAGAATITQDTAGFTPLISAAVRGHVDVIQALIPLSDNLDHLDNHGWSAATWAASHNNPKCLRYLLLAGADPNLPDFDGELPIIRAVRDHFLDVLEVLVLSPLAKPTINQANLQGQRPLHLAIELNIEAAVSLFLKQGADLQLTNHLGEFPLDLANSHSNQKLLQLLTPYL